MENIINFISNIDNSTYNKIRHSKSDAECRRYLKEQLTKQLTLTDVGSTLTDKEKIDYEIAQKRKDKDYNIQGWGCAGITVLALIVVGYNLLKYFAS